LSLIVLTERPLVPEWIEREILKLGGKTGSGLPLYRLMWGASKVAHPLDITSDYDPNRWHLEKHVEGHYQHAYKFGYCPHVTRGETKWCKACYLSGGETFELGSHYQIIERVIQMFVLTERLQKSSVDKGAKMERDALLEREQAREKEAQKAFSDALLGNLSAIDRVPHSISPRGAKTVREVDMPLHAGQIRGPGGKKMPTGGDIKQF
jgi:hypothetical protein